VERFTVDYTCTLNAQQRTATYCNTLQHSATLCNRLQHSAAHTHTHKPVLPVLHVLQPPSSSDIQSVLSSSVPTPLIKPGEAPRHPTPRQSGSTTSSRFSTQTLLRREGGVACSTVPRQRAPIGGRGCACEVPTLLCTQEGFTPKNVSPAKDSAGVGHFSGNPVI